MTASDRFNGEADAFARAQTVVVWDLPTRLFKWGLVAFVAGAWISSGFQDPAMTVHKACGYGVLILTVYRVLWGFFGGEAVRFARFVRPPRETLAYLSILIRGGGRAYLGHNPAGGLMIVALLLACAIQGMLGFFASDGVEANGPLAEAAGERWSNLAAHAHALWFYAILALAALHILANLAYQFLKREDVIGAMITGRKPAGRYQDARRMRKGSPLVALGCLCAAMLIVYLGVVLPGGAFFATAP
jgi:cytochrome b